MKDDTILSLAKKVEPQLVGILISHELVKLKPMQTEYTFGNLDLTEKALIKLSTPKNKSKLKEPEEEFMLKCLRYFPPGFRSTKKVVRDKLTKYMTENPTVPDHLILKAFRKHNQQFNPPYCGNASNFISKKSPGQVAESRLHSYIEAWLDSGENSGGGTYDEWDEEI